MKRLIQKNIKKLRKALGIKLYSDYIEEVHQVWWGGMNESCCKNGLSYCIDNIPDQNITDDEWHCCPYWRRRLTNKLTGRAFAVRHGVPVPELYWYGKNIDEIPFDNLPSSYVIKTSFGAGAKQVLPIINGINVFNDEPYTNDMIRGFFREHMAFVHPYGYLMIEELLRPESGESIAKDYKVYVFDGIAHYITVVNRLTRKSEYYTREWGKVTRQMNAKYQIGEYEPRPKYHKELIEYAERLGKACGHTHARIDFFITDKGCVFGEFTATPSGGGGFTPYANRLFGRLWREMGKR